MLICWYDECKWGGVFMENSLGGIIIGEIGFVYI